MKIRIKQLEILHREVTYIAEVPDDTDIKNIDSYDVDSLTASLIPQFGQENIVDMEVQSIEKV